MAKTHLAEVSLRDLVEGAQSRPETILDFSMARDHRIALARITPGGSRTPAAITIRTIVVAQEVWEQRVVDEWRVCIAPTDSENLLRRLAAQRNPTIMGAMDAPVAGMHEASYDMQQALDEAHQALSRLSPPRVGTFVEMTLAYTAQMEPIITFRSSSIDALRRARGLAKVHNAREREMWEAGHAPFRGPRVCRIPFVGTIRIWPWVRVEAPDLVEEPEIPQRDPWGVDGELYGEIGRVVVEHFLQIMESLWKATFAQDPFVAAQLERQGYALSRLNATQLGLDSMQDLMERLRSSGQHMTLLGEDPLEELGEDAILELTRSVPVVEDNHAPYEVEYEDER